MVLMTTLAMFLVLLTLKPLMTMPVKLMLMALTEADDADDAVDADGTGVDDVSDNGYSNLFDDRDVGEQCCLM